MYRVKVYDTTGTGTPVVIFFKAIVTGWTKRINAPGTMTFRLPFGDPDATAANLQPYRQVRLDRLNANNVYETVWSGYIESSKENGNFIDVICQGLLALFKKRYTGLDQSFTDEGTTEAFGLLTGANGDAETGIVAGAGGVTDTQNVQAQGQIDLLRAWEQIAAPHNAEFEIDDAGAFNFVPSLGSDKSTTITLRYRRDSSPGSNVIMTNLGEDGSSMANRVIGTSTAGTGLASTKNDLDSQAIYGLLVEVHAFDQAQDQGTLDDITQAYLDQRANPITDYRIQPMLAVKQVDIASGTLKVQGIQFGDIGLGDLVNCDIVTENQTVHEARRVAEIDMVIDENDGEQLFFTLSKAGVFITEAYLNVGLVAELKRRIREIETLL